MSSNYLLKRNFASSFYFGAYSINPFLFFVTRSHAKAAWNNGFVFGPFRFYCNLKGEKVDYDNGRDSLSNNISNEH